MLIQFVYIWYLGACILHISLAHETLGRQSYLHPWILSASTIINRYADDPCLGRCVLSCFENSRSTQIRLGPPSLLKSIYPRNRRPMMLDFESFGMTVLGGYADDNEISLGILCCHLLVNFVVAELSTGIAPFDFVRLQR